MITTEQKKKYEEVAKEYALRNAGVNSEYISEKSFKAGAEHAHSEGKKEGINETLDQVDVILGPIFEGRYPELHEVIINELQKLRK